MWINHALAGYVHTCLSRLACVAGGFSWWARRKAGHKAALAHFPAAAPLVLARFSCPPTKTASYACYSKLTIKSFFQIFLKDGGGEMKDFWDEVEFLRQFVGVGNVMDFSFSSYWTDIFGWAPIFPIQPP